MKLYEFLELRRAQLARLELTIRALQMERRVLEDDVADFARRRRSAAAQRSHKRYDAPDGSPVTRPAGARPPSPPRTDAGTIHNPRSAPRLPASPRQPFRDTSAQHP